MKKTIALLFLISNFSTIACPDLTGTFYCQTGNREVTSLDLRKEEENGVVSFRFIENQDKEVRWIVDGKLRSLDSSPMDGVSNTRYSASCSSEELLIQIKGHITDIDVPIHYNIELSLDEERNLSQSTSGTISDGRPLPRTVTHCLRDSSAGRKK